jgi:cell division protein FtsI/penicillin-binding protein 2
VVGAKATAQGRLRIISLAILVVALAFMVKLYFLQVVHHQSFAALADKQYLKQSGQIFSRGTIYFSDKEGDLISAATLQTGYLLTINPKRLKDKEETYQRINEIYPIERESFFSKASKTGTYAEIADRVPDDKGKLIAALNLPGVALYKENWRYYPGDRTAANVLGFLGYDSNDNFSGRYGLESKYDSLLERGSGDNYANFFVEIFSSAKKLTSSTESFEGDIVATIEPTVQASLEDILQKAHARFQSTETGAIIMDPKTGEIYAMANLPTFNPNDFSGETNVSVFANPMVGNVYEMGSIIKPLTMAAGIDAGVVTPQTMYDDRGSVTVNSATIHNHDRKAHGVISMQKVLDQSLNTGVAYVVSKLGSKKFTEYMHDKFGLGERTGIDLPSEALNLVSNLKSPRDIEYITASFGQGIAMTPISTIRALSVLGNGGTLPSPHIVKRINYTTGIWKTTDVKEGPRAISPETSLKITKMLVETVDNALLGGKAKNPHYSVAAKTGTAQIAKPGGGGYYDDRYLHSFMGYFPAYEPKFIILLYTYDPKTDLFAADTLAQPFLDLSKFLINYYQLPPDR